MKRWIHAKTAHGVRSPKTKYVYEVCDAMGWEYPMYKDKTPRGYRCKWGGRSLVEHKTYKLANAAFANKYGIDDLETVVEFPEFAAKEAGLLQEYRDEKSSLLKEALPEAEKIVQGYIDEIYDKTGIRCFINKGGNLIVPYGPDEWED